MKLMLLAIAVFAVAVRAGAQQSAPVQVVGAHGSPAQMPELNLARAPWGVLGQTGIQLQIQSLIPEAQASGSSGKTLGDAGTYKVQMSVRTASGGAEVHAHWDDVMVVEEGCAQLITGGTVVEGKTDASGETHGTRIEGGHKQLLTPGDVVTVHAGTPHQLILAPGVVYGAVVIKVHEP